MSPTLLFTFILFSLPGGIAHANGFTEWLSRFVGGIGDATLGNMFEGMMSLLESAFGFLAAFSGEFLDAALRYSINGDNLQIAGIVTGWTMFRDLVNILFIFILLYAAIMTILQVSSFQTRKVIVNVVLVGIFINFSFFLAGFVIDISNGLAQTLYSTVSAPPDIGIGDVLVDRMRLDEIKEAASATSNFQFGMMHLFNAIFFIIAAFVFLSGAFLFILRHISLMFILMLSPIAFAALILPETKRYWNLWLNRLLADSFVAPIYLLAMVVTIGIASADDLFNISSNPDYAINSDQVAIPFINGNGFLLNYIVIIGLVLGSLKVAKAVSGSLAGTATRWAGRTTGFGVGAAAFAGRRTIGRAARSISDSEWLKQNAGKRGVSGFGARAALRVGNVGSRASFDVRGSRLGSTIQKATGLNFGRAGGRGGYDQIRKDQVKRREDLANQISSTSERQTRLDRRNIAERQRAYQADLERERQNARARISTLAREREDAREQLESASAEEQKKWEDTIIALDNDIQRIEQAAEDRAARKHLSKKAFKEFKETGGDIEEALEKAYVGGRGDARRTQYADTLSGRHPDGTTRVGSRVVTTLLGQTKANREAAHKIRRGKPTIANIKKALEDAGEIPSESTTPEPPPEPSGADSGESGKT